MPKVTFLPLNKTIECEAGETLLEISEDHHLGLEHACGGVCACSTCHIIVKDNTDKGLEEMEEDEMDTMDKMVSNQTLHSRLGCQARVKGDVVVEIVNWPPREL